MQSNTLVFDNWLDTAIYLHELGINVPRKSVVKPKNVRKKFILERVKTSKQMDEVPVWEGDTTVACKVIKIPLDHLLLRMSNRRTIDAQESWVAKKNTFKNSDGSESSAATKSTFESTNEGNQDSQNHQFELLLREAEKESGRVGGRSLTKILADDGWSNNDRPVITPEGVLINGNCRVAAIEHLLETGVPITKIKSASPMIEVKVVPTIPVDDKPIVELERKLQHGEEGRLNYNWIQDTTDMRMMIKDLERDGKTTVEAEKLVHPFFASFSDFKTFQNFKDWLDARTLLDHTLKELDKAGQAYDLDPPKMLFYDTVKNKRSAKSAGWFKPQTSKKFLLLLQAMLQVSIANEAKRELRYDMNEIKSEDDLDKMIEAQTKGGLISKNVVTKVDQITGKQSKKTTFSVKKTVTKDEAKKAAEKIRTTAQDIKEEHGDKDLKNRPMNKLAEVIKNLEFYSNAMDKAKANKVKVDTKELKKSFGEIEKSIKSLKKNL